MRSRICAVAPSAVFPAAHSCLVDMFSALGDTFFRPGAEQELYGVNEMDANLWKAYFRANAEYITR